MRGVAEHAAGAGYQHGAGHLHGAREGRRRGAVLARIVEGAHLARVFQRLSGLIAGQPVHLQQAAVILASDGGGRRPRRAGQFAKSRGAAAAEQLVAFGITVPDIDGGEIVVHAQQVPVAAAQREAADRRIGGARGFGQAAHGVLVDLDLAGQVVAAPGELHQPLAPGLDLAIGMPKFRHARARQGGQIHLDTEAACRRRRSGRAPCAKSDRAQSGRGQCIAGVEPLVLHARCRARECAARDPWVVQIRSSPSKTMPTCRRRARLLRTERRHRDTQVPR